MGRTIVAVNAGPRKGWNTETLVQVFNRFVGPAEIFLCGNTLQLKDYSKTDWQWSMFDPEAKKARHETVFPQECRKVFDMGAALAKG